MDNTKKQHRPSNNYYVITISLVAALIGLLFGWFMSVISGAEKAVQHAFLLDDFWHGFTISVAVFGNLAGAVTVGRPADAFGRKKVLVALALLITAASLGCAVSPSWGWLVFFRLLGGFAAGGGTVMGPMYIAEVAPAHLRGRLVMLFQLMLVIGILLAFGGNYLIARWFDPGAWRWMLGIVTAPAVVSTLLMLPIPPTPRWLVLKGRLPEARMILERLDDISVDHQLQEIQQSMQRSRDKADHELFSSKYKYPLLFVLLIALFNQLAGITAVMNYSPRIFEMGGFVAESALLQSVLLGGTNMLFTVAALPLIDRFGRKKLLIWGSLGMIVFLGLTSHTFFSPAAESGLLVFYLVGFIASFASSQGAVVWVFISEIMPNRVRAKGQAAAGFVQGLTAALITWFFPVVAGIHYGNTLVFGFFALMMLLQLVFVAKYLPETKGKTLEQIQADLGIT